MFGTEIRCYKIGRQTRRASQSRQASKLKSAKLNSKIDPARVVKLFLILTKFKTNLWGINFWTAGAYGCWTNKEQAAGAADEDNVHHCPDRERRQKNVTCQTDRSASLIDTVCPQMSSMEKFLSKTPGVSALRFGDANLNCLAQFCFTFDWNSNTSLDSQVWSRNWPEEFWWLF